MKKLITISILSLFLFIFLGLISIPRSARAQNNNRVPGQILVKFKQGTSEQEIDKQINIHRANIKRKIEKLNVLVLKIPEVSQDKIISTLSKNPNIEFIEPDYYAQALFTPNDTYFDRQWGLENIGQIINSVVGKIDADIDVSTAWDTTQNGVKVAILDVGINENHPDLLGKVVNRQDFTNSASGTNDVYGHGTHVAGIVAATADNSIGIAGVCPGCLLLNGKVLDDSGSGAYSWIANGIIWAADNGAQVINLSLGGSASSTTLESAVNYAWSKGVVVVAAAGNSNNSSKTYPGAYLNVIAVAATDNQDKRAYFSSYGSKWVDVAAPGVYVFSTWKDSTSNANPQPECFEGTCYKYASGTSMSTPMVAGIAGLVWTSIYNQSAFSVRARIESTADKIPGTGTYWSAGRVNAASAVSLFTSPTPTPSPTPLPSPSSIPAPTPIVDTQPPTVSIVSPASGSFVYGGKRITILASASDNVKVKKVNFYVNGSFLRMDKTKPYTASWRVPNTKNVTYTIKAIAYDTSNNTVQASISVTSR
ncbi:MAG: peptidase S8 [Candidatus Levybacteria bacterium CG22_combo_CG10-13_8_21_14_all_35_11]|nr:MAG: peptidase S8 [Candidatus Levybacteria bacterium CG22_combo_CG10-13_8_21_14_all_35_11]